MSNNLHDLNQYFDHAALQSVVDEKAIVKLCDEARKYEFYAVAVNPVWVKTAVSELRGTKTKVLSTAGFPLGANRTDTKIDEAARAVKDGAAEIDMVANIGWLKSGQLQPAEREISQIRKNIPFNIILKVIIEASLLTQAEQIAAARAVINGGAQFVKTGTGFFGEVSLEQVKTLYQATVKKIEVKASGGIKTIAQCRRLIEAGASRLGSSASVAIMQELQQLNQPD